MRLTLLLGAPTAFAPISIDIYLPALSTMQNQLGTDAESAQPAVPAFFSGLALGQALYGPVWMERCMNATSLPIASVVALCALQGWIFQRQSRRSRTTLFCV